MAWLIYHRQIITSHHHQSRIQLAGEGRSVTPVPWPRLTVSLLHRSAGGVPLSKGMVPILEKTQVDTALGDFITLFLILLNFPGF